MSISARPLIQTILKSINASLIDTRKPTLEQKTSEFKKIIDVNLFGTLFFDRAILAALIQRPKHDGILINMSSELGKHAIAGLPAYCASKFAVEALSQSLHLEYGEQAGIFAMDPGGGIATDMIQKCEFSEAYLSTIPTADDWAKHAVPFILSLKRTEGPVSITVPHSA